MKELTIEISIDEVGGLEAETFGFKGKVCESELRSLLQGEFVIEEIDKKGDYYQADEEISVVTDRIRGEENMSSRVVITTKKFCTESIGNLYAAIELCGLKYDKTQNAVLVEGCRIEIVDSTAYMRISSRNNAALALFSKINGKLAEIETQLRIQQIEKNRAEQERARAEDELYRARQLKRDEERLEYEKKQLELERQNFVDAKKKLIIARAKEKGYSVEERLENGVVKLKLVKRVY